MTDGGGTYIGIDLKLHDCPCSACQGIRYRTRLARKDAEIKRLEDALGERSAQQKTEG